MALQEPDGNGLFIDVVEHACAFAEDIDRADARTTEPENIGIDDGFGRAEQVAGSDFLDEPRNIDVRGTGSRARRIETEQAAVGFSDGSLRSQGRVQFQKATAGGIRRSFRQFTYYEASGLTMQRETECTRRWGVIPAYKYI